MELGDEMPDRTPDELARYWDALTIGSDPGALALDPFLAEVIRCFEQSEYEPSANPTFVANRAAMLTPIEALRYE